MRLLFFDPINWDYSISSVYDGPLGGSQSALCLLAEELAQRGHSVCAMTNTTRPGIDRGVNCLSAPQTSVAQLRSFQFDACIILNAADRRVAEQLRRAIHPAAKLCLWTQHAADQPAMRDLEQAETRAAFDAFVLVSDWQRREYLARFGLPDNRSFVLRNAVSPPFAEIARSAISVVREKSTPPMLAYTSTPFRGLDLLLELFPRIRAAVPGTTLRVFSSLQVYRVSPDDDVNRFGHLYRTCRILEGVEYVGSLPQRELARQLRSVTMLAYPNTFAETSCIAAMEALAAGCCVITSDLGALPETTAGFSPLVSFAGGPAAYKEQFVATACDYLRRFNNPRCQHDLHDQLLRQMEHIQRECTWEQRASQWEKMLSEVLHSPVM